MESIVRIFNRNADRGIIGATTALFLAPKSGKELRDDLGSQASALKDKTDRMTADAKEKALNMSASPRTKHLISPSW